MTQAWPKGKMIEGCTGRSGRGTRRELWAHLTAVLLNQRIVRCIVYRRSTLAALAFPSAASSPSHLPAGHGEKFRRTQAHVQLGTRLRRMAGPKGQCTECKARGMSEAL